MIQYLSQPEDYAEKEQLYLEVRRRETRVLTDEALMQLPEVKAPAELAREWRWRKRALERLDEYLQAHFGKQPTRMLDLGCGNGWMSNRLAAHANREVWAADLNETELLQGSRVFTRENLRFVYADVLQGVLPERHFDVIVLAASVQYFPDLQALVQALRKLLLEKGQIHVLDSHFYPDEAAQEAARQRTMDYYQKKGVPEMASYYHHHLWKEAQALGAVNLNEGLKAAILQRCGYWGPFPWMVWK